MKFLVAAVLLALPGLAQAQAIERACLASPRQVPNQAALCGCIQRAADLTLTRSDQRLAARFFQDPQRAQDTRQSSSQSHSAFWQRYRNFGAMAEASCSLPGS